MRRLSRYALATALVIAAALAQVSFANILGNRPFFLFFCAVFASAVFCGLGPSLLTIVLSCFFVVRYGAFPSLTSAMTQTLLFAALGVALTAALSRRRDVELRAGRATTDSLRMLNEVSDVLSASLEYEESIAAAARLAVMRLGDWCAVSFVDDSGCLLYTSPSPRDA